MSELHVVQDNLGGLPVIRLTGALVHGQQLEALHEIVRRLVADGSNHIVLEVTGVDGLDSTGISTLLGIKRLVGEHGRVALLRPTARVRSALAMIRATVLFEVVEDESQLAARPS